MFTRTCSTSPARPLWGPAGVTVWAAPSHMAWPGTAHRTECGPERGCARRDLLSAGPEHRYIVGDLTDDACTRNWMGHRSTSTSSSTMPGAIRSSGTGPSRPLRSGAAPTRSTWLRPCASSIGPRRADLLASRDQGSNPVAVRDRPDRDESPRRQGWAGRRLPGLSLGDRPGPFPASNGPAVGFFSEAVGEP